MGVSKYIVSSSLMPEVQEISKSNEASANRIFKAIP